jgi:uncharacterized damage-inducible protein DinB
MPHDPLDVLFAHDRWATEQLLAACAALDDAQLDRPFPIGRGSLRATLVHLLQVIDAWDATINGRAPDAALEDERASVAALTAAAPRVYDALHATCRAGTAADTLHLARGPYRMAAPRGAVLTHLLDHGTHHRAQALNILRQLGVQPLPQSSVLQWMLATGVATMSAAPTS